MRAVLFTSLGLAVLAATSAEAAPIAVPDKHVEIPTAPAIELVAQGCGYGYRRTRQDQWGYWHWGRCVPLGNLCKRHRPVMVI